MELHRFSAFDYMKLIVGSALVAAAFQFFTFPNSIVSGGVTGIAQIIHLLTRIPVGVLSILINEVKPMRYKRSVQTILTFPSWR